MSARTEEFIVEAREHLQVVEETLLALERQPASPDASALFDRCFRSIHSIKGDAGFLGFSPVHQLAHAMESLLSATPLPLPPRIIEALLSARDRLAVLIDDPARCRPADLTDMLLRLAADLNGPPSVRFEIDLENRNAGHPGGIREFVLRTAAERHVREGHVQLGPCDLRERLPSGPVLWVGVADTQLQVAGTGTPGTTVPDVEWPPDLHIEHQTADLTEVSDRRGGLVSWFRELTENVRILSGQLTIPDSSLRSALPRGPVLWSADCQRQQATREATPRPGVPTTGGFPQELAAPESGSAEAAKTVESTQAVADSGRPAGNPSAPDSEKSTTLRIQVDLLDRLMTLVGELTLVRNQSLLAFAAEDGPQRAIIQRLNSVTSELQDATLRARMQPVGNLWNRFPRMVRDLARQLGKQVDLELQGREVELDKTILEQLSDPLMHLIRNSVDHGIENPQERLAKGKTPAGHIVLSATHDDGQVHIQIRDDGRGIDPEAVRRKALLLGLRTEADLARMSPRELFSLILLPGFSTAASVTEISGRGVGMDVVRTNIELLEGTLSIDSVPGHGCATVLRMPLTLAIIPCLMMTVGEDRYAVPQRDLDEVVCLHPRSPGRIEQAFDTELYRLRGRLLPIARLNDVLRHRTPFTAEAKAEMIAARTAGESRNSIEYLLVLKSQGRRYGLVVDNVCGTQEIVVKPLHPSLKRIGIFAGSTIMGDGRVALITNSDGIAEHARLSFRSATQATEPVSDVRDAAQVHRVLLFEYGPHEQFALPLIQIRRIVMLSQDRIERVGDHEFVTVDGVATRILRMDKVTRASSLASDAALMSLILPKFVPHPIGILVSQIVDTESLSVDLQQYPDQDHGILGSAVVRGRLTLFLDIRRLSETLLGERHNEAEVSDRSSRRSAGILLIDDTAFFREVVKRCLAAEGYEIVTAIHGEDGLAQLAGGREFDLIVSDIEMPVMDGWEFAREVRRRGIRTPMLALTSLSGMQYENKARECGFDSYEVKLDHDRLIRRVGSMLAALEAVK